MWITDARSRALEATPVITAVAVDADLRLLNILGQQQHCRTTGSRRRYSVGNAETMSAGVNTRRQKTDTAENNASAFNEPLRPLVS